MGNDKPDIRSLLANERTLLAWIRTSVALMAFGFVIAKFRVFLAIAGLKHQVQVTGLGLYRLMGAGLVVLGVITLFLSSLRFRRIDQAIREDKVIDSPGLYVVVSLILAIIGGVLAIYVIRT